MAVSPPQRPAPTPTQARLRVLILGMLVVLIIGVVFFRGSASDDGAPDDTTPVAAETTTTVAGTGTTALTTSEGSTTTTPDSDTGPDPDLPPLQEVKLELVFDGIRQPSGLTAPVGDDRLFVLQRFGLIRILDEDRVLQDPAFLDISDRVLANGIEQGLLGLAFHPDYD